MDNWRDRAECRTEDPDLFFPIGTSGPSLMQTEQAKAVCRRCPVREPCLRFALDTGQTLGVWGGTGETERRAIARRAGARRGTG
ncbi:MULTISPECIES: WhiB family transcriptional regulator [Streptomyces]|uniref:Transcriptional regulator WhiB n=2 Tax=Streptomyces TaxID=1883 RepID=A0A2U9NWT2_STRAS|nr:MULTISPECIES: WhiB family transcriptional regulator [Streptomyces]AWT41325.1 WhiB family transcriptional regulator [Streptomyces actuosus]MBM4826130.1 WhiB family transcriptional regulator [Streptomyces actuosus]GHF53954.1 transcriptional regulator WhiB [Streptomyces griseosporeus]